MGEGASRVMKDMDFQKLWDSRDRLIGKLLEMEAQHEKTKRALAEAEARMRELDRLEKDNGAPSKVNKEDYGAPSEVYMEPPLKLSAQLRTRP